MILSCEKCGSNSFDSLNHGFRCQHCGTVIAWDVVIHKHEGKVTFRQSDFTIRGGKLEKYNGEATEVVIPDNVTIIGNRAFENCSGITSVTIPSSVTRIEGQAFTGCFGLTSIVIPESVISIGWYAFSHCISLTSVTLSNGVKQIGASAFEDCPQLTTVTIPDTITSVENNAFLTFCRSPVNFVYPPDINLDCVKDYTLRNCIEQERNQLLIHRRSNNLCLHCGGPIKGFWSPKCTQCGHAKDY